MNMNLQLNKTKEGVLSSVLTSTHTEYELTTE